MMSVKKCFAFFALASICLSSAPPVNAQTDECPRIGHRTLSINANGYKGTLKILSTYPISPGYKFSARLTMNGEPTDEIKEGRCRNGMIFFTRRRAGAWVQEYSGRVFKRNSQTGSLGMVGTFSHNGAGSYNWHASN